MSYKAVCFMIVIQLTASLVQNIIFILYNTYNSFCVLYYMDGLTSKYACPDFCLPVKWRTEN